MTSREIKMNSLSGTNERVKSTREIDKSETEKEGGKDREKGEGI